jgi:hypothetical protein
MKSTAFASENARFPSACTLLLRYPFYSNRFTARSPKQPPGFGFSVTGWKNVEAKEGSFFLHGDRQGRAELARDLLMTELLPQENSPPNYQEQIPGPNSPGWEPPAFGSIDGPGKEGIIPEKNWGKAHKEGSQNLPLPQAESHPAAYKGKTEATKPSGPTAIRLGPQPIPPIELLL